MATRPLPELLWDVLFFPMLTGGNFKGSGRERNDGEAMEAVIIGGCGRIGLVAGA